jgi:hypothetical protein
MVREEGRRKERRKEKNEKCDAYYGTGAAVVVQLLWRRGNERMGREAVNNNNQASVHKRGIPESDQ